MEHKKKTISDIFNAKTPEGYPVCYIPFEAHIDKKNISSHGFKVIFYDYQKKTYVCKDIIDLSSAEVAYILKERHNIMLKTAHISDKYVPLYTNIQIIKSLMLLLYYEIRYINTVLSVLQDLYVRKDPRAQIDCYGGTICSVLSIYRSKNGIDTKKDIVKLNLASAYRAIISDKRIYKLIQKAVKKGYISNLFEIFRSSPPTEATNRILDYMRKIYYPTPLDPLLRVHACKHLSPEFKKFLHTERTKS